VYEHGDAVKTHTYPHRGLNLPGSWTSAEQRLFGIPVWCQRCPFLAFLYPRVVVDFSVGGGRFRGCGSQRSRRRQFRCHYVEGRGNVNIFIATVIILLIIVINYSLIIHPNSVFVLYRFRLSKTTTTIIIIRIMIIDNVSALITLIGILLKSFYLHRK